MCASLVFGLVNGLGFLISGVLRPSKVIGLFTLLPAKWDPTVLIVMATVAASNVVLFSLLTKEPVPVEADLYVNHREGHLR